VNRWVVLLLAAAALTACDTRPDSWCDMPETCHRPVDGEPGTCEAETALVVNDCTCPEGLLRYWDCERFTGDADAGGG